MKKSKICTKEDCWHNDISETVSTIKGWSKWDNCKWWEHVNWSLLLLGTFILGYVLCMIFMSVPNLSL